MIPYLQAENLSKRYGDLVLFENISFTIFQKQKVALIAKNGVGKTSLMELLAGNDSPDAGKITITSGLKVGYLKQNQDWNYKSTVFDEVFRSNNEKLQIISQFEEAVLHEDKEAISRYSELMDKHQSWDAEVKVKQILTQLKITEYDQKIGELSGGQQKRIALANVLINEPDILLLDEPTNHLDLEMIEWLENYLEKTNCTLFMVTHDRYFLDRICDEVLEMDSNSIYRYKGNYSWFLEKRAERMEMLQAGVDKAKNLLRTELEWARRMPKARGHKAKYRMDQVEELKSAASLNLKSKELELGFQSARTGKKIIDIDNISKSFGDLKLIEDFSYKFARYEKVGIIGKNGTGKSTFLNLLTGFLQPDKGIIEVGQTIRIGYYQQEGINFNPSEKVLDVVKKIAEVVNFDNGKSFTASQLLTYFLFPPEVQYNLIEKLSGGEKRRLYLCTVLMQNPNFLILDEPTNDLDIMTLNVLEEYLAGFNGSVIIVSHDRYFMDKIVDHLFVFEGNGTIKDFPGSYTHFRNKQIDDEQKEKASIAPIPLENKERLKNRVQKLSYSEKQEFEKLGTEISALENEKKEIETALNSGELSNDELLRQSQRFAEISEILDEKEMRWLELSEKL
ncbi:MAG: ABC transporter [Bacteroidetes bacterium GWF2_42_66]|nr:MAG: ABC transporter [Bacteroidetes bacterium GWA2_42_15]OFY02740.1 MAG: ABC transporter [Bacteroidetes bacterium GWE2_42_39]OFY43939.1 MAG: ABC transporter [Bacteroidetes bacterium GWF2_42_66]HBL77544.1 ABC transporter [Prolixibacteraceae bacterium]HCR89977.1 ABC transporter [Prolixibacteraceae bacterium]